jgi:hypothetical protein
MSQQTSLAAAITSAGQASITVADFLGFPASGEYTILIDSEQLRVTAGNGTTTWTVTRGYGGTTAVTHLISTTITHVQDAYAELSDLTAVIGEGTSTAHYGLYCDLLGDVSADIDSLCGRRFYRSPAVTGTTTVYLDVTVSGQDSLRLASAFRGTTDGQALDIISIASLYVRDDPASAYVEIAAGDTGYYLERGAGEGLAGTGWPYEDITLSPQGTYTSFPAGKRAVKLIAALGFASVPSPVKRACIDEAHERFRQALGGGPSQIGVTAFGTPIFLTGDSPQMRRLARPPYRKIRPGVA